MRRSVIPVIALALSATLAGCVETAVVAETTSAAVPCVDQPELTGAVDTLWAAREGQDDVTVFGPEGSGSNNLLDLMKRSNLAAMANPNGSGIVVSIVYAGDRVFARSTAHRAGWLVLNQVLYPIDVNAAQTFGVLKDVVPVSVAREAGLGSSSYGMEAYGVEDFVSYNDDTIEGYIAFLNEANQLCAAPTPLGL
jgi:uncharacterized lipoprotein YehR (DUF1307 family)